VKVWYDGCVAPASSTGSGDGVANSGDGGGGSNAEELEGENGASSGRKEGERKSVFVEGGRGEGRSAGEGRGAPTGLHGAIDASVTSQGVNGGSNGEGEETVAGYGVFKTRVARFLAATLGLLGLLGVCAVSARGGVAWSRGGGRAPGRGRGLRSMRGPGDGVGRVMGPAWQRRLDAARSGQGEGRERCERREREG
jgi:hypothetical protein